MKNLTMMAIVFASIVALSSCGNSSTSQTSNTDSTMTQVDTTTSAPDSCVVKVDTVGHSADTTKH